MRKSYGEGFMSRVFPLAKGMFGVKGMREGGLAVDIGLDPVSYTGGNTRNPHIGEEEIKGELGTTIFEYFENRWNDPTSRKIGVA